jgi:uncharacterized phage infection (PIP) family protein YhgE
LAYSDHIETQFNHPKEKIMNVLKNFEALFVVVAALACSAAYTFEHPTADTTATASASNMQVVVVSAKRLTAEEKLQSLLQERAATVAANTTTSASKI